MIRNKPIGLIFGFTLFLLIFNICVLHAEKMPFLSGVVKDTMGRILPGVEIFISPDNFSDIVLRAKTDHEGRFFLRNITPGTYKIAAAKMGYRTDVKNVIVEGQKSSDITMKPLADTLDKNWKEKFPKRLDWIRRIPRKDILKELEASVLKQEGEGETAEDNSSASAFLVDSHAQKASYSLPFTVELRQIISREFSGEESPAASDRTNKTAFSLSKSFGDEGRIRVEALKNKWKETFLNEIETDLFERKSESLGVAGQYDFGGGGKLGFTTFYEKDRLNIKNDELLDALPSYGTQKGWGYSATWEKEIDHDMLFDLNLTHAGSEFEGAASLGNTPESLDELITVTNQIIRAMGKFQAKVFDHHEIDVGLKTLYHSYSSASSRIFPFYNKDMYYFTGPKEGGYQISLYGKDRWMVLNAVTISYGFQYYHFFFSDGIQVLSPVFEIEYQGESGSSVRAEISYAIDSGPYEGRFANAILGENTLLSSAGRNFSCKAEVEKKLGEGASIKANIAYIPLLLLNADSDNLEMVLGDSFLFMTNGHAASLSAGTFIEKRFDSISGGIGLNYGVVEGTFSSLLPNDLPIQIFRQGDLDYLLGILKATSHKTKTKVFMQLRKVRDQSSQPGLHEHPEIAYTLISLKFSQNVPVFHRKGITLNAILEYDDTFAMSEFTDNIERSLLPYRRLSGGFQIKF
jgi:hypothetical protein